MYGPEEAPGVATPTGPEPLHQGTAPELHTFSVAYTQAMTEPEAMVFSVLEAEALAANPAGGDWGEAEAERATPFLFSSEEVDLAFNPKEVFPILFVPEGRRQDDDDEDSEEGGVVEQKGEPPAPPELEVPEAADAQA